jgi:hypothetical protein
MLPVQGVTRIGRAGLLQALIKAGVPSEEYGLELPRAVVAVHWEGYAQALYGMQVCGAGGAGGGFQKDTDLTIDSEEKGKGERGKG